MTATDAPERPESNADNRRQFLQALGLTATAAGLVQTAAADTDDDTIVETEAAGLVPLTHGVASGDVTDSTAVVWGRADGNATIQAVCVPKNGDGGVGTARTSVDETTDFTGHLEITDLASATDYRYIVVATKADTAPESLDGADTETVRRVWREREGRTQTAGIETGTFRTAPAPDEAEPVRFAWSGDTWGYGDDPIEPPFPGLQTIAEQAPDFFLYHGDTIYADAQTPAGKITEDTPIDDSLAIYREKYKEMRVPPAEIAERTNLKELLRTTSVYTVWDDHEVINNFAGPIEPLMPDGRRAFREYWPLDRDDEAAPGTSNRFYDSFRWGKHLELFIIDTRQYRDPNVDLDAKSLLGDEQLAWLKDALAGSDATWKVLASPAPLGYPSDSWATPSDKTGYESELLDLLEFVQSEEIDNLVTIAGDVHKSVVGGYDPDDDGTYEFVEGIAGPLGAPSGVPDDLYAPLNPTEFFAKGEYTNFGAVEVDESGETLTITIYADDGTEQFAKTVHTDDIDPSRPDRDRIESTFDDGPDGWLVSQNGGSDHPAHRTTGGNPGGHITEAENQGGIAWYYQAPFKFLGDREAFYGGTLSFDCKQAEIDWQFDAHPMEGGDVLLASGETKLVYEFRGTGSNPGTEWTTFDAPLTAEAGWIDLTSHDPFATEETFRDVLANLDTLRIRGEYRSGDDRSFLDNVVLRKAD
ncbi:alkaline phosphatase D family protein [Halovivax asiaticus]|nr:alkaline phosphatase D family protein [Halovivax asiaticus]